MSQAKPEPDASSQPTERDALDRLFQRSQRLRQTEHYRAFLDFIGRLSNYSPFNGAILHVQRPGGMYFATQSQWKERFGRHVKANARPCVILQPFGPILFVFAAEDTLPAEDGTPLPEQITDPFAVDGTLDLTMWHKTYKRCEEEERVKVQFDPTLSKGRAGFIASNGPRFAVSSGYTHVITLRGPNTTKPRGADSSSDVTAAEQYATFAHEMAHLFCGHLGASKTDWWPDRRTLSLAQREIEAESVAYLVCRRAGLHSLSERYLHTHVQRVKTRSSGTSSQASSEKNQPSQDASEQNVLPPIGLEAVLKAVKYVEDMGKAGFESKRDAE